MNTVNGVSATSFENGNKDHNGPHLPRLFTPMPIRGIVARNRIVVSPMCQYKSVDGAPTDWHLVHLGKFAMGGAGIVFCEETAIEARGRKTYGCAGLYNDAHVVANRRITDFIRDQGALSAIQLGHSGRKAACGPPWTGFKPLTDADAAEGRPPWKPVSSSPEPTTEASQIPHAMEAGDIRANIAAWREAALRAIDAGFDICEVHGAHGYLIQQFLSPIVNKRTDGYGGDRSGRMRFALEIVEAVRDVWPKDRPLFFRVSAVDGKGGHWDIDDTVALSRALKDRGVDVVDCSSGGISGPLTMSLVPRVPGYQVPFARAVRQETGIATMAVGLITEAAQAEQVLVDQDADLIALARELLYNPNWPVHAAAALGGIDPLDFLPPDYRWWLDRREQIRSLTPQA